jgi:hypothetical protein
MQKLARTLVAFGLSLGLAASPAAVSARRRAVDPAGDMAVELEAPPHPGGGMPAGAPVMIRPPHPPPVLTAAQVRSTLNSARPDLEACLPATVRGSTATVRAILTRRAGLSLRIQLTPRDPVVSRCLDTAARRWLVPLEGRPIGATVSATLRVSRGSVRPPPPIPPVNPPPPNNSYDEGLVHASLDRRRAEILQCMSGASTSTPGDITLRLSVHTDGSIALEGASLPAGVGGGLVLSCLSQVVGSTRVPSPPTTRSVTHIVTLGR